MADQACCSGTVQNVCSSDVRLSRRQLTLDDLSGRDRRKSRLGHRNKCDTVVETVSGIGVGPSVSRKEKVCLARSDLLGQVLIDLTRQEQDIENSLVEPESSTGIEQLEQGLSSFSLDSGIAGIAAPTSFSRLPALNSWEEKKVAVEFFPVAKKFSGQKWEKGAINVQEYLLKMTRAQELCKLSESEFSSFLSLTTTGKANQVVENGLQQNQSIREIYFLLLLHFDRSKSLEQAKLALANFVAKKNSSFEKTASSIQHLATLSSNSLPVQKLRTEYSNLEAIKTLIKSLPSRSSIYTAKTYQELSSHSSKAPTFSELIIALSVFKDDINQDIRENGAPVETSLKEKAVNKDQKDKQSKEKDQKQGNVTAAKSMPVVGGKAGNNNNQCKKWRNRKPTNQQTRNTQE